MNNLKSMKKLAIGVLAGYLVSFILPVYTAFAAHRASTYILFRNVETRVIPGTQPFSFSFDVNRFPVLGDTRAAEANVTLTIRTPDGTSCFPRTGSLVRTLASNVTLSEGSYGPPDPRFTWDGRNASGTRFVPDGTYCYHFVATDAHGNEIFKFPRSVRDNNAVIVDSSSLGGSGSGSGSGGGAGSGSSGPITQSRISHTAHPDVIDLFKTPPDTAFIDFTVLENLPGLRMTLEIYGPDGFLVNGNFPDFPNGAGSSGTFLWNGNCSGGASNRWCNESGNGLAESGIYTYRFFSGGQIIDTGRIVVTNEAPAPAPQFIVSHEAVPQSFAMGEGSSAINFETGKQVSNLRVEVIRNDAPAQRKILSLTPSVGAIAPAGNYVAHWDGTVDLGGVTYLAPAGTYTYAILGDGENTVFGTITITEASPSGPFIVAHSGSLETTVSVPVTIDFETGREVSGLRVRILSASGATALRQLVISPSVGSTAEAGDYSATWDARIIRSCNSFTGVCTLQNAAPGVYRYELSATGQTPVTGEIRVLDDGGAPPPPPPPQPEALEITNVQLSPGVFSPRSGQSVTLTFTLNQPARVDINVYTSVHSGLPVLTRNILTAGASANITQGTASFIWNGHSSFTNRFLDRAADNGTYTFVIDARGTGGQTPDTESASVVIFNQEETIQQPPPEDDPQPTNVPSITNLGAFPAVFNPEAGQISEIQYRLNVDANITVRVYPAGFSPATASSPEPTSFSPLRTLVLGLSREGSQVNHSENFDGRDSLGQILADDTYPYVIRASNANGTSYAWGLVTIRTFTLNDLGPTKSSFRPDEEETTTLRFTVNRPDVGFVVTISGGSPSRVIRTLPVNIAQTIQSGSQTLFRYDALWDGRDSAGQLVATNTYTYRIQAFSQGNQLEKTGWVRTERTAGTGGNTGRITPATNCAGFIDVSANHSLCPAIRFVVQHGIFLGDGGRNTLRLNDMLNRAESARVTQSAFGYRISSYDRDLEGNLGYPDLNTSEWYMPYIKTFTRRSRNILRGYPNGLMRPARTMNRAEMFKMFLEASFDAPEALTHFTLTPALQIVNKPYNDTPINHDTKWYLPYADFVHVNDLVASQFFFPGRGITRAMMIKVIYDTHVKGLISYGVTNTQNIALAD